MSWEFVNGGVSVNIKPFACVMSVSMFMFALSFERAGYWLIINFSFFQSNA